MEERAQSSAATAPPNAEGGGGEDSSHSGGSSLTLSLTPPLSDTPRQPDESSTISEHLSSIEHDRSLPEVEVENLQADFSLMLHNLPSDEDQHISQEPKPSPLEVSSLSNNSNVSVTGLDRFVHGTEGRSNVKSILEEILGNEQFKSGSESKKEAEEGDEEESLNIFANVSLDDKLLNSYNLGKNMDFDLSENTRLSNSIPIINNNNELEIEKRVKDFEELLAIKDSTIAALTSELDSFRDMMSNPSSTSMGTNSTEYKQFQEECHNKILEYHNAIVHKDDLIQKLTESLHQSILNREELKQQSEHFRSEITQLQRHLGETTEMLKRQPKKTDDCSYEAECSKFEGALGIAQLSIFNDLKIVFNNYVQQRVDEKRKSYENEISNLKTKLEADKLEHDNEISRLRDVVSSVKCGSTELLELKDELEDKHSKEMEELRTYFEKKCADLEKNYSEEVFSQQSRKMSGSSSCSDLELLPSDFAYPQPGPGGDTRPDYSKRDVAKLQQSLSEISALLSKHDLGKISEEEFNSLKEEIRKFDLKGLFKFDFALLRSEMQNKYHAELEILREDFDNRVDVLNVEHQEKLRSLQRKHEEEIEELNHQMRGIESSAAVQISTAVQEVASSGDFEIDEVVQSYERRLQEQVSLAKLDIIGALEKQIQRLASSEVIDEDWPEELLLLRDRFSEKYTAEISDIRAQHDLEISRLKEEHVKTLNGALERARRRSLRDADSLSKGEMELLKERDNLRRQSSSLRTLVGDLCKYCIECEDELNNTLVGELLRQQLDRSSTNSEDLEESCASERKLSTGSFQAQITRVHLAPNVTDLIGLIDKSVENDFESIDLKGELGICLAKLRADANAVLALSCSFRSGSDGTVGGDPEKPGGSLGNLEGPAKVPMSLENKVASLTRQLISETQAKNELSEQLGEAKSLVESLEAERTNLEEQLDRVLDRQKVVEGDLAKARDKIAELIENGHKEIVSEGYGEDGRKGVKGMVDAVAVLTELQDKVRNATEHPKNVNQSMLMHLVEDLSRAGEKIVEEATRDREDLRQQIEAADKKYKVTCQFLEDQAAERELERDDAQREIDCLREQIRERDKDRASCERISSEVDHLEQQLKEAVVAVQEAEKRFDEVESERKEAVEKIFVLRDIIRDLEQQVEVKSTTEDELRHIVAELEIIVKQQAKGDEDLSRSGNAADVSNVRNLHEHIGNLEEEVQRLRLSTELAGSEGALKQIRNHLCDFETTLDKRTKDLEGLHAALSATACSSPSEDMSIRDVVHPTVINTVFDECEVPLQQLSRLKEKLVRHSRAEDAAVKRIRDMEMHMFSLKTELEESHCEKEILKKQISDQLVLISSLQIRLDDQRIRAEHIEKQTNTSLEVRIYDLQNNIITLEEKMVQKEKTIAQLNTVIAETKQRLEDQEKEMAQVKEDELIARMQEELEAVRGENSKLKTRMNSEARILPNIVDNIISDKNSDIEMLREKLSHSERQLELYNSLNLDRSQLELLRKLMGSGVSFKDVLEMSQHPDMMRRAESGMEGSLGSSPLPVPYKRNVNETVFLGSSDSEISRIEKVGAPNLFHSLQTPMGKQNSTEKHVRFDDESERLKQLQSELDAKSAMIEEYRTRLRTLDEVEAKILELQANLEATEDALKKTTECFEQEQKARSETEKNLRLELAAKKMEASEKQEELEAVKKSLDKKQEDVGNLKQTVAQMETELIQATELITDKEEDVNRYEEELKKQRDVLEDQDKKIDSLELNLGVLSAEKQAQISDLNSKVAEANKELQHLQQLLVEKEKIIVQMSEDSKSLHANLETIQNKMQESGNIVDLGRKLREEQKKNLDLLEEVHSLKAQLFGGDRRRSIDDITGQVQKELEYSAYLDETLVNALSDHSSLENQDIEDLHNIIRKQRSINKQLTKARDNLQKKFDDLELKYEELRHNFSKLQSSLEKEKRSLTSLQMEDAKLIEQMRIKLDSALDNGEELERVLEAERIQRTNLERQLETVKQKLQLLAASSSSKSESTTEYRELQNLEVVRLQKDVMMLQEKNRELQLQVRDLKKVKAEASSQLEYVQDMLTSRIEEVKKLEERLEGMGDCEKELKEELQLARQESQEKARQIEESRKLVDDISKDYRALQLERDHIVQELNRVRQREMQEANFAQQKQRDVRTPKDDGSSPVSEKLMAKIKELNNVAKDNIQMLDLMTRMANEKAVLEERIAALENMNFGKLPFDDPVSRANYLFAKYLRADSYRKALIWQKRYLSNLLASYQTYDLVKNLSNDDSSSVDVPLLDLTTSTRPTKSSGKERFKRVALAVVALKRMTYLVRRWHSGKRIVEQRNTARAAQFHVGQPVSSQNFVAQKLATNTYTVNSRVGSQIQDPTQLLSNPSALRAEDQHAATTTTTTTTVQNRVTNLPMFGDSPPSKDLHWSRRIRPQEPLTSPGLLGNYLDRFNQIQEKLGMVLDKAPS